MTLLNVTKTLLMFFLTVVAIYVVCLMQKKSFLSLDYLRSKPQAELTALGDSDTTRQSTGNATSNFTSSRNCTRAKKIVFMKTHKCASSTIENILYRYALRHDWNLALPLKGNYLSTTELFNHSSVTETPWGDLDMHLFALHNRWNFPEVEELMGDDLKVFSIVRDPVDLFESLYGYMRLDLHYGANITNFTTLVSDPNNSNLTDSRFNGLFGRNQMSWDFGTPPEYFDDESLMSEKINSLDDELELVLVTERMEESLVLLRHLLCWPVEDLTHLVLNQRQPSKVVQLDTEERKRLTKWLNADYMIYDHYTKILDEKVKQFNAEYQIPLNNSSITPMEYEIQQLRQANSKLVNKCVIEQVSNANLTGKFHESNNDIMGYRVQENIEECHPYAMNVQSFLKLFRERMERLATSSKEEVEQFR